MGKIADFLLNGTMCESCGTYLGSPVGYSRNCYSCQPKRKSKKKRPPKKCVIWNPYSETLKVAYLQHTLNNWYAIIGTDHIDRFYMDDGEGTACLYADHWGAERLPCGVMLQEWAKPVFGILLFVGLPDNEGETTHISNKAIARIKRQFEGAMFYRNILDD